MEKQLFIETIDDNISLLATETENTKPCCCSSLMISVFKSLTQIHQLLGDLFPLLRLLSPLYLLPLPLFLLVFFFYFSNISCSGWLARSILLCCEILLMHSLTADKAGMGRGVEAMLKRSSDTRENLVSSVLLTLPCLSSH